MIYSLARISDLTRNFGNPYLRHILASEHDVIANEILRIRSLNRVKKVSVFSEN